MVSKHQRQNHDSGARRGEGMPKPAAERAIEHSERASPVDHDQFPDWLRSRLLNTFGKCDWGSSGWTLFEYSVRQPMDSLWIDHEGTAMVNGQEAFVSEPYLPVDYEFSQVHELAAKLGCLLIIDEKSHHLPGKTIRLAIVPTERDARSD